MFKFEADPNDLEVENKQFPKITFTLDSQASLPDMVEAFEDFLKASGFTFVGKLDIIVGDEEEDEGGIE